MPVQIRKPFTSNDFTGLMGMLEMELAVARLCNLARERCTTLIQTEVSPIDFKSGYERDGLDELIRNGWMIRVGRLENKWTPHLALAKRIQLRFKEVM